ncbi:MAG TPA: hypothetical protein VHW91_00510 [Candidatus Dormibacteraeota bacterium]|jgi:hypothetical protein|nr:hypothetical protein [Candidatus Dormibacteraeota bacterium]
MRSGSVRRQQSGPFLLPARVVLLFSGILAIGLAVFNLVHELHARQVDQLYTGIALAVGLLWLAAVIIAFLGWRSGVFLAALIAFVEFGVIASSHFVSTGATIGSFAKQEGLPVAAVDIALIPVCLLVIMSAAVCWTTPDGRTRAPGLVPLSLASLAGAVLVILQATDAVHRVDFGTSTAEDGAFVAALLASIWLAGGLWIVRAQKTGALLIAAATFGVAYSFVSLHLLNGGKTVAQIASVSGPGWAGVAVATAVVAAGCFLTALAVLVLAVMRRKPRP